MSYSGTDETLVAQFSGRLRGTDGVLVVSNRRVTFAHKAGVISKKNYTVLDLPLEVVQDVSVERKLVRRQVVILARGQGYTGLPRVEVEVEPADQVAATIMRQVRAFRRQPATSTLGGIGGAPVSVVVNVPRPPESPPKVMVRCSYCKTVFAETDAKCPSCGAHF